MAWYLTDKLAAVSDAVRHQETRSLADDLSDLDRPATLVCCASSDEARDRLCADYGIEALPRVEEAEHQPGDRAIVGSWGLDGRAHWCLRSFE